MKDNRIIYGHLLWHEILRSYTKWYFHGEDTDSSSSTQHDMVDSLADGDDTGDDMRGMVHDAFRVQGEPRDRDGLTDEVQNFADKFHKVLLNTEKELYPGCKFHSKLSFFVRLWHIKCLGRWSNRSFSMLLDLLREVLLEGSSLLEKFSQNKKIISNIGLNYNKIDACPNDCMLYWKEFAKKQFYNVYGTSQWKTLEKPSEGSKIKSPAKILHHFPLIPCFQRLYMSSKTTSYMRWHDEEWTKDGIMRHPADSPTWRHLNPIDPSFENGFHNVRLGLTSDGFNPFRTMSITHSTWPVVLIPYNLPPWLCMKQSNMIL